MQTPLWSPTEKNKNKTHLTHFISQFNEISNDTELYTLSIKQPERFWNTFWNWSKIIHSKKPKKIVTHGDSFKETSWFEGAELNFAENLLRHRRDKEAIVFFDESGECKRLSSSELYTKVNTLSHYLKNECKIKAGDRVGAWLPNIPETIIGMLAATSLGAIWSSVSLDFGSQSVIDRMGQITPKVLLVADGYRYKGKRIECLPKVKEALSKLPFLEKIVLIPFLDENASLENTQNYNTIPIPKETKIPFAQLPFNHPLYIMYSSGTTGLPKGIIHSAGGTLIQHLKEHLLHGDLHSHDKLFFFTTCGWMMWNWLVSALAIGTTLYLYEGSPFHPSPTQFIDLIEKEKITAFGTSAKYLSSLQKNNVSPIHTHNLSSLKTLYSTGSPLLSSQFDYIYNEIKKDLRLSSISGGTDIISCFALGHPHRPVNKGELQSIGYGMAVDIYNEKGESITEEAGELVCTQPFPSMPIGFWNDPEGKRYHNAYFTKFPGVWAHGDWAKLTKRNTLIIYGRSDATLNPGGVRIGTSEIYRQLENIEEIEECVVAGKQVDDDEKIYLFVKLSHNTKLSNPLKQKILKVIREGTSPRHLPSEIYAVSDIPKTINGKIAELAVKDVLNETPVRNKNALANPEVLIEFLKI